MDEKKREPSALDAAGTRVLAQLSGGTLQAKPI